MSDRDETPEVPAAVPDAGDPGAGDESESSRLSPPASRPPTGRVRIEGIEAGTAVTGSHPLVTTTDATSPDTGSVGGDAGATPDPLGPVRSRQIDAADLDDDAVPAWSIPLPDWRDPPREVPRVLLEHSLADEERPPGPVWREVESDWSHDDLTFADIVGEGTAIPEHSAATEAADPFDFLFDEPRRPATTGVPVVAQSRRAEPESTADTVASPVAAPQLGEGEPPSRPWARIAFAGRVKQPGRGRSDESGGSAGAQPGGAKSPKAPAHRLGRKPKKDRAAGRDDAATPARSTSTRDVVIRIVTGLAAGALVLLLLKAGPPYILGLTTAALIMAAVEGYQALRHVRYRPAVFLGLLGVPAAVLVGYFVGPQALPVVAAAFVIATLCWFLLGRTTQRHLVNASMTIGVWAWIGLLGSFAGLLLSPSLFPHRHGLAYFLGAIEATVAYDVGAYLFGSLIGKHRLAPNISPNKTWEGLAGGSFAAIAISLAVVTLMSPWTVPQAFALGVVVAVLAPLGDFVESMIKRDLGVKDMGAILPAHGGVLDRIDALLFVVPATYCLVRLFHG